MLAASSELRYEGPVIRVNLVTGPRKRCTQCKRLLHVETCFAKNNATSDGRHTRCKTCKRAQDTAAYHANIEERRAKARAAFVYDPEKHRERKKRYYAENPDYRAEQIRLAREKYGPKSREKRKSDPRFVFVKRIRDRLYMWLRSRGERKQRKTFELFDYGSVELQDKLLPYLGKPCELCRGVELSLENSEIDHIVPLCTVETLGEIVELNRLENLRLICKPCNQSRPRPSARRRKGVR